MTNNSFLIAFRYETTGMDRRQVPCSHSSFLKSYLQFHQFRVEGDALQLNSGQGHRQGKPPRPGAAGVEEEDAILALQVGEWEWPKMTALMPAAAGSRSRQKSSCRT